MAARRGAGRAASARDVSEISLGLDSDLDLGLDDESQQFEEVEQEVEVEVEVDDDGNEIEQHEEEAAPPAAPAPQPKPKQAQPQPAQQQPKPQPAPQPAPARQQPVRQQPVRQQAVPKQPEPDDFDSDDLGFDSDLDLDLDEVERAHAPPAAAAAAEEPLEDEAAPEQEEDYDDAPEQEEEFAEEAADEHGGDASQAPPLPASVDGSVADGSVYEAQSASGEAAASMSPFSLPAHPASRTHCPQCSVAFDREEHAPILLHAGHTFCRVCMQNDPALQSVGIEVTCPLCSLVVTVPQLPADPSIKPAVPAGSGGDVAVPFPINFRIWDELEVASLSADTAAAQVMCGRCDDVAVAKCRTCLSFVCEFHETDHRRSRDTQSHELQSLADFFAANPPSVHSKIFCGLHPSEEFSLWCLECSVPICVRCSLPSGGSVHATAGPPPRQHPTEPLSLSSQRQLHELHNANEGVKLKYAAVIRGMLDIQTVATRIQQQERLVATQIGAAFERVHEAVEQRKQAMLARLADLVAGKNSTLNRQNQGLYLLAKSIEDASIEVDEMLASVGGGAGVPVTAAGATTADMASSRASTAPASPQQPPQPKASGATCVSGTAKLLRLQSHLLANLDALLKHQPVSMHPEDSDQFTFFVGAGPAAALPPASPAAAKNRSSTGSSAVTPGGGSPKRGNRRLSGSGAAVGDALDVGSDEQLLAQIARCGKLGDSMAVASFCTASGSGLSSALVRVEARFTIQARDRFNQKKSRGGDPFAVEFITASRAAANGRVVDHGNGKYTVRYVCLAPGVYTVQVSVHGRHIAGSPFRIAVKSERDAGPIVGREWVTCFGERGSSLGMLLNPLGLAAGSDGLLVANYGCSRVDVFGLKSPHAFTRCVGQASAASPDTVLLKNPWAVAVDPLTRNVYVADSGHFRICVFSSDGDFLHSWGGVGGALAKFRCPAAIAIWTPPAALLAAAAAAQEQQQQPAAPQLPASPAPASSDAADVASPPATPAHSSPSAASSPLQSPSSMTALTASLAAQQLVVVADRMANRVQVFDMKGALLRAWGTVGAGPGQMRHPSGVCVSPQGTVFVSDFANCRVQAFTLAGTFITMWGVRGQQPGMFLDPTGVCCDRSGLVYVCDSSRVQVFTPQGGFVRMLSAAAQSHNKLVKPASVVVVDMRADGSVVHMHESVPSADGVAASERDPLAIAQTTVFVSDSAAHRIHMFQ